MSWQLRGWLLLTFALLATALVASTAGAGAMPSPSTAVLADPSASAGLAHPGSARHEDHHSRVTMV